MSTAQIVYLGPEPREIRINKPPREAQGGQQINTAFADSGPYLLVTEKSFEDVKDRLPAESKVEIIRFRPNIVVGGTKRAWDEDDWKEISIGDAGTFFVVARCPRCLLPKQTPQRIRNLLIVVLISKLVLKTCKISHTKR